MQKSGRIFVDELCKWHSQLCPLFLSENQLDTCRYHVELHLYSTKTFGKESEQTKTLQ